MSSERAAVSLSSYNVPVTRASASDVSTHSGHPATLSEHPLLAGYEPSLKPLALSGLAAIRWAGRESPDLLDVPPLNDMSYPPIHPDFIRLASGLSEKNARAAYAGATVLAIAAAYQDWMHATNTQVKTIRTESQRHETRTTQQIDAPEVQWAAGGFLHGPGFGWQVRNIAGRHAVQSNSSGVIQLSAAFTTTPDGDAPDADLSQERHYFLNLHTHIQPTFRMERPGWATGVVEAGIIDHQRFASVESANFQKLARMAQLLSTLAHGEHYLVDIPQYGYDLTRP